MGDTNQLGDSPGNLVEFPWEDLHFPHPALECFEFWLSMEGLNFCEGQIRTGLFSQGRRLVLGQRAKGKGTDDNPGPVVHLFGNMLIHLLLFLLQVRDESR